MSSWLVPPIVIPAVFDRHRCQCAASRANMTRGGSPVGQSPRRSIRSSMRLSSRRSATKRIKWRLECFRRSRATMLARHRKRRWLTVATAQQPGRGDSRDRLPSLPPIRSELHREISQIRGRPRGPVRPERSSSVAARTVRDCSGAADRTRDRSVPNKISQGWAPACRDGKRAQLNVAAVETFCVEEKD